MGSRLGMAEPVNCTLSPLRTPLLVLLPPPPPLPPLTAVAPARTLREADEGPEEMLAGTLRSNWPGLGRCREGKIDIGGAHDFVDARGIFKADATDVAGAEVPGQVIDETVAVFQGQALSRALGESRHGDGYTKQDREKGSGKGHKRSEPQESIMAAKGCPPHVEPRLHLFPHTPKLGRQI